MCKLFCCYNILLDLASKPGWDGDDHDLEERTSNLEKLQNLIESGEISLYVPQEQISLIHLLSNEDLGIQQARLIIQKILELGTSNIDVDYDQILEQANSLDYPDDGELFEGTCLIAAQELKADVILARFPHKLSQIVTLNSKDFSNFDIPILNLNSCIELLSENPRKFNQNEEIIYTFTPEHRIIKLPNGATPIDFAYALHTNMGNKCVKAFVDGVEYPLDKSLNSGNTVEIIKGSEVNPNPEWLKFVRTTLAKKRIQRSLKYRHQAQGWLIIKQEIGKTVRSYKKKLEHAAQRLNCKNVNELAVKIGSGEETITKVKKLIKEYNSEITRNCLLRNDKELLLIGIGNRTFKIASCCNPLPRQPIIGFSNSCKRPIRVHRADCSNLKNLKSQQGISLHWNCDHAKVQLQLRVVNCPDIVRPILNKLVDNYSIIPNFHSLNPCTDGTSLASVEIILNSSQDLETILKTIQNMSKVVTVKVKNVIPVKLKYDQDNKYKNTKIGDPH